MASFVLLFGHFVVPFLYLVSRHIKRRKSLLAMGAVYVLSIHWFDLYYLVMPQVSAGGIHPHLEDLTCFLGMAGLYVASMAFLLKRCSLVPERDPRLAESLAFENS